MKTSKINNSNKLAIKMAVALILGLIAGVGCIILRESLNANGNAHIWTSINNILFQDISKEGATNAIGIFYILGQLFVNALQLVIVPMVFTSIALAMCKISDTKKLGRISYKTILGFLAFIENAAVYPFIPSTAFFVASAVTKDLIITNSAISFL